MGQFCSGGSGPDLDVNTDRINEMIDESLAAVESASKENVESFTSGIADAGDDPFKVPDSETELNKESTEQDIGMAAVSAAFASFNTEELKANIWKEVEAHVDAQIEAMEEEKRPDKDEVEGAKKDMKAREVDGAVDTAFADKQAELEKSYEPEPVEEEKPAADDEKKDDEKAEDNADAEDGAEDAKEDAAKEDAAEEKPADDAAKEEEEKPADDAAKEEEKPAEEEADKEEAAAEEEAVEEEAAADEPAAEEAAAEDE